MSPNERPIIEVSREVQAEYERMKKRLVRLEDSVKHTPHRKVPRFSKMEIESLRSNIKAMERRHPLGPDIPEGFR
jgi:hypothetical protein